MSERRLRVLMADDEELARDLMRRYVASHDDLVLVAECADGDALQETLEGARADLAFLDIQMPGRDVFDVLATSAALREGLPIVIFATAYERYAIRAFEVHAVDYLVKPFTADRFAQAVGRARERVSGADRSGATIARLAQDLGRRPDRLLVPSGDRMVPVLVADIDYIRAEGDYARLHLGGKSHLVSRTLADLERRLDPNRFVRIHRSTIVNADRIREVRPEGSSRFTVVLHDGTRLILSRSFADILARWKL